MHQRPSPIDAALVNEFNALVRSIHSRLYGKRPGFDDFEGSSASGATQIPGYAEAAQSPARGLAHRVEPPRELMTRASAQKPNGTRIFSCFAWFQRKQRADRVVQIM